MRYIYNDDLEPIALVPNRWGIDRAGHLDRSTYFRFALDEEMRIADISFDEPPPNLTTFRSVTVKAHNIAGTIYPVIVEGLEYLLDHPEVATFPRARANAK